MAGKRGLYRVWMKNLSGSDQYNRWNEFTVQGVAEALKKIFGRVIAHPSCPYSTVDCFQFHNAAVLDPGEVLVYFVASSSYSIVNRFAGDELDRTKGGYTTDRSNIDVISEVWIDKSLPDGQYVQLLANLAFHEIMHNKLDTFRNTSPRSIHETDGTGLASGLKIPATTQISQRNIQLMGPALAVNIPQFTQAARVNEVSMHGMPVVIEGSPAPSPDGTISEEWYGKEGGELRKLQGVERPRYPLGASAN